MKSGGGDAGDGIATAEAAWRKGAEAAETGDFATGLLWLERAQRLAPNDPRITLDLANIRLRAGGLSRLRRAEAAFLLLAERYDVAQAWLGLMAARRLLGAHPGAAEALHELLNRHCVPEEPGFAEVASAVAEAANAPGWCGIDGAGRLHFGGRSSPAFLHDAAPAPLRHLDPAPATGVLLVASLAGGWLGSPLRPARLRRCEGVVACRRAGLGGWVSRPAAPAQLPELTLLDARGARRKIPPGPRLPAGATAPLTARYRFRCPPALLRGLTPPFRLLGPDGRDIFGSPIDPSAERATIPVAAEGRGSPNRRRPVRAALAIVVPVFRGLAVTRACLLSVLPALPAGARLIVIDDAGPDPTLRDWLDDFGTRAQVELIRHAANLGFPAAANTGLRAAQGCDVLLLNSDTLLPPDALPALLDAVYSRADIGSATPFSNEASLCSYPRRDGGNPAPDLPGAVALNALASRANGKGIVEIPTGVGFCLLMRHDCIARTGLFRPELFAQGYGEEVDWCLRARHLGYCHVAATGAYVAHVSRASFGAAGIALNQRNGKILLRLYAGYQRMVTAHYRQDPLAEARARLDAARFRTARQRRAALLISHNHGGGVQRRIETEMREIRDGGARPILLYPAAGAGAYPHPAEITDGAAGDYPNLRFRMPADLKALLRLLRGEGIGRVVLHHGLGHHPDMRSLAERLGCRLEIVVHDYASFCPRVHLIGPEKRYCGEPDAAACRACVRIEGDATGERLSLRRLLARSAREFAASGRVTAPSLDAARRIARHFPGVRPEAAPWEDDSREMMLRAPGAGARRIVVPGGIGRAKGYDVLLECAQDAAARGLPLEYVIAGGSADDARALATGRIFVTGAYRAEEQADLLAELGADLAFIPSIWPETWCFTLGEVWSAGLYCAAFDLGAQAERIRTTGRGFLLPLGLPAARVNEALLAWHPRATS